MKKLSIVLMSLLLLLSFVGCGGSGNDTESSPIIIGLTDAFTGDRAGNGDYTKEGAELFLEDINGAGGVLGREVQIVYEDDGGTETGTTNAYQKLILENDVCATVINKYSSCVLAVEPYIADAEIPAICSGSNVKIEQSDNQWLFSTRRSDYGSGETMAAFINQQGAKNVAILYSPDALGKGMSSIVIQKLNEYGINIVSEQQYSEGEKQFATYVAKIKSANPDFIIAIGQTSETGLIAKAVYDAGLNDTPCMGNSAFAQATTIEQAGNDAIEGWYSVTAFAAATTEEPAASWVARYTKKYGHAPEMTSITTYDALSIICHAIEEAGSDDRTAIRDAIRNMQNYEGMAAIYSYNGTPMLAKSEYVIQIHDGATVVLQKVVGD